MQPEVILNVLAEVPALSPEARHDALLHLHRRLLDTYRDALLSVDAEGAARPVDNGEDARTLTQVVAHIGDWQRFQLLGMGDVLGGLHEPRAAGSMAGYVTPEGETKTFDDIHALNAYQAARYANWTWQDTLAFSMGNAAAIFKLFETPGLLTPERLEATVESERSLTDGRRVTLKLGWLLWIMELEHIGLQHRTELGIL